MNTNNFPDDKQKNKKLLLSIVVLKSLAFYKTKKQEIKMKTKTRLASEKIYKNIKRILTDLKLEKYTCSRSRVFLKYSQHFSKRITKASYRRHSFLDVRIK